MAGGGCEDAVNENWRTNSLKRKLNSYKGYILGWPIYAVAKAAA